MDIQKIMQLVERGKGKEAQKQLAQYLDEIQMTERDAGHVYAEIASAYLKANNYLLKNYNTFLKETVAELKALNKKEQTLLSVR